MKSRKSSVVLVLLAIAVLLLSLWDSAPAPTTESILTSEGAEASPPAADEQEPNAELKVTAVASSSDFAALSRQNESFRLRYPDIRVELARMDPAEADLLWERELWSAEDSDLWLVPNERVKALAVAGELMPADGVFVGEAISEPFDVLLSQVRWNGYIWGVPRDMDPHVIVWNRETLRELGNDADPLSVPLSLAEWRELALKLAETGGDADWLAIDDTDPLALLAWVGSAARLREDAVLDGTSWTGSGEAFEQALSLLAEFREGVRTGPQNAAFWRTFAEEGVAAVARHSEALLALDALPEAASDRLHLDRSSWERAFVWPGGQSFVLSAKSQHEEAAQLWAAEMTSKDNQLQNYRDSRKLPVYRSLFSAAGSVPIPLHEAGTGAFPNMPALASGPDAAERLSELGAAWNGLMDGSVTVEDWKRLDPGLFADF